MTSAYKCAKCGNPCGPDPEWTEADACAEVEARFGVTASDVPCDVLCDDCYAKFVAWFERQKKD